jgi:hypothetical protein
MLMRALGKLLIQDRTRVTLARLATLAPLAGRQLIDAIDDYVEKLTGDRRSLHAQNHGIGGG